VTEDWTGTKYLRLTVVWDYENRKVHLWMPGYIKKASLRFKHDKPEKIQNSPIPMLSQHTEPKFNMLKQKTTPPNLAKTTQNIFNKLLGCSSTPSTQLNCYRTSSSHRKNNDKCETIVRLRLNTRRGNNNIWSKRHGTISPQRRQILQQEKGTKLSRWPLLPIKQRSHPPEQQSYPHNCKNHKKCDVVGCESRIRSLIPQRKRNGLLTTDPSQTRPPPTTPRNSN
jgi:hypothetical protein